MTCNKCYECDCNDGRDYCQDCLPDEGTWLIVKSEKPDPFYADRNHAYMDSNQDVWILNRARDAMIKLNGTGSGNGGKTYKAGQGITISPDGTISAVVTQDRDTITTVKPGNGILVAKTNNDYTVSLDSTKVPTNERLENVERQIGELKAPKGVASVSVIGKDGIVSTQTATKDWEVKLDPAVKANIDKVKSITDKPFGVNIMLLSPFADDIVDLVIEEGVKVVTTGAGNPGKYMDRFHEAGITVIPVVPSVALAKRMEKLGADAVIAEGMEAGGHIGKLTTMTLVRQVVEAVSIPVIGAGGVADGSGAAAVFMLGAEAVQVGTRFVVAKESNAHQNFKNKILKAKDIDTVVSASVVGHPVRAIKNKLASAYNQAERDFLAGKKTQEEIEELGAGALRNAVVDGDVDNGSVMAGQIAGLVSKEETCAEILEDIYYGAAKVIQREAARWADVNV